jgi:hypothetical protein
VSAALRLAVVPEGGELPPEEELAPEEAAGAAEPAAEQQQVPEDAFDRAAETAIAAEGDGEGEPEATGV